MVSVRARAEDAGEAAASHDAGTLHTSAISAGIKGCSLACNSVHLLSCPETTKILSSLICRHKTQSSLPSHLIDMRVHLALLLTPLALTAAAHRAIYKWTSPSRRPNKDIIKRAVSYEPEFGECGEGGDTCSDACGAGFEECRADADDALFCYNPDEGETCCTDGSGSMFSFLYDGKSLLTLGAACEDGFYCASDGEQTVCCPGVSGISSPRFLTRPPAVLTMCQDLSISKCGEEFGADLSSVSSSKPGREVEDPPDPEPTSDTPARDPPATKDEETTTTTLSSTTTRLVTKPFPSSSLNSSGSSSSRVSSPPPSSSSGPRSVQPPTSSATAKPTGPSKLSEPPITTGNIPQSRNCSRSTRSASASIPVPTATGGRACNSTRADLPPKCEVEVSPKLNRTASPRTEIDGPERTTMVASAATPMAPSTISSECASRHNTTARCHMKPPMSTPDDSGTPGSTVTGGAILPSTIGGRAEETIPTRTPPPKTTSDSDAAADASQAAESSGTTRRAADFLFAGIAVLLFWGVFK